MRRAHIVMAKRPIPGRVKTRLCPPLSLQQAADLAGAALVDTMTAIESAAAHTKLLCFDGDPSGWLKRGWLHHRQRAGTLDLRLADALGTASGPAMVVGMDTPQLTAQLLNRFDPVRFDACIGPTSDGGYWTIGLRDTAFARAALVGVPMSTARTYAVQLARLRTLGLSVQILDELDDVDTFDDAVRVARLVPSTAFGAAFAALDTGAA